MKYSMKYFFAGALALICMGEAMADSFTDPRDGKTYKMKKMPDGKIWMTENLKFDYNHGSAESVCYENKPENCEKYGRLYTWAAAMDSAAVFSRKGKGCGDGVECNASGRVRGVCPEGWHLPSEDEFEKLLAVSCTKKGDFVECDNLRVSSWNNGTDKFGFSAFPAGSYSSDDKDFSYDLSDASFWSSTECPYIAGLPAIRLVLDNRFAVVPFVGKRYGFSVRCIQDDSSCSIDVGSLNTSKARATIKTPGKEEITIVEAGSRSVADVLKVVKQRTPGLRHIYDKFVKKNKSCFQGTVALKLTIDSSGYITNVSIASSTTGTGEFDNEIKTAVSKWRFNNVASGNTVVTIPFVFDIRE